jgi:hypothetical protein
LLLVLGCVFIGAVFGATVASGRGSPTMRSTLAGAAITLIACMGTWLYAVRKARPLAFLRALPSLHTPRAILLRPIFALGLAGAALCMLSVRPVVALAFLGCWCWAASVGYRFAARGGWAVVFLALPLSFLGLFSAFVAHTAGRWPAAAVLSLSMAVIGYLTAPRDSLRALPPAGREVQPARPRRFVRVRRSSLSGKLWTTIRVFTLAEAYQTFPRPRWLWFTLPFAASIFLSWLSPVKGVLAFYPVAFLVARGLSSANEKERVEFLTACPLEKSQLRSALVGVWLLFALLAPITSATRVTFAPTLRFAEMEHVPGAAAVIAQQAPQASMRRSQLIPVTPPLRRLLLQQVGHNTLLHWATFTVFAAAGMAVRRKASARYRWALAVPAIIPGLFLMAATITGWSGPWWLAVLLAAIGTRALHRELYRAKRARPMAPAVAW